MQIDKLRFSLEGDRLMDNGRYLVRVKSIDKLNKKVLLETVENQGKEKPITFRLSYKNEIEKELIEGKEISLEIEGNIVIKTV